MFEVVVGLSIGACLQLMGKSDIGDGFFFGVQSACGLEGNGCIPGNGFVIDRIVGKDHKVFFFAVLVEVINAFFL